REGAGKGETDRTGARIRVAAEHVFAPTEHLRPRLQLDVDLEADDGFPLTHRGTPLPAAAAPRCRLAPRRWPGIPPAGRAFGSGTAPARLPRATAARLRSAPPATHRARAGTRRTHAPQPGRNPRPGRRCASSSHSLW